MSEYVEKNNIDPTTGKVIVEPIVVVSENEYVIKENIDPITGKPIATPIINIDGSGVGTGGDVTKAYVDRQDASTLQSANVYTDTKLDNYYDKAQSDTNDLFTLQGANGYTDTKLENYYDKQQSDANDLFTLQGANGYTDGKVEENKLVAGNWTTIDENNIISAEGPWVLQASDDIEIGSSTSYSAEHKQLKLAQVPLGPIDPMPYVSTINLDKLQPVAGDGVTLTEDSEYRTVINVDKDKVQEKLTSGSYINIDENNVIRANPLAIKTGEGSGTQYIPETKELVIVEEPLFDTDEGFLFSRIDLSEVQPVAGDNITITEVGGRSVISATGGSSGVDVKLDVDPTKTKWVSLEKNLQLSNTDGSKITLPLDNLIDYGEFSTELGNKVDKTTYNTDKANLATKQMVQDLSPTPLVSSVVLDKPILSEFTDIFDILLMQQRFTKSGESYTLGSMTSTNTLTPLFRHVMRRHTYNVGTIASNNAVGVNVLSVAPTIVVADVLFPETYVGGATPNNDRLWTVPISKGLVNWVLELNIRGNITGTNDADDLLRIELWNGTQRVKVRSILRSQLNDAVDPSAGIDIPFYTNKWNDPMCIPTGGFKVLLFNRTGAEITNLVVDMRIKR